MREDHVVSEVLGSETPIAPSDLYNTSFRKALRGYSKAQVDTFLRRVGDALEKLIKQVRELKDKAEEQRAQLAGFRERENTLQRTLVSSQKFNETIRETAKREADAIVAEARAAKAKLEVEAARTPDALREEIARLEAERNRLRADLEAILEAHCKLVERIPAAEAGSQAAPIGPEDDMPIPRESEAAADGARRWPRGGRSGDRAGALGPDLDPVWEPAVKEDAIPAGNADTGMQLELETTPERPKASDAARTTASDMSSSLAPEPYNVPGEASKPLDLGPEPWLEGNGQPEPKEESKE